MRMTYKLCLAMIKTGKLTEGMVDVYFAAGRLTEAEYMDLIARLRGN